MSESNSDKCDVVIVGAGIVGASLGYALGKQGYHVKVIERSLAEPGSVCSVIYFDCFLDRIVGELMQPGGILRLRKLGLECNNNPVAHLRKRDFGWNRCYRLLRLCSNDRRRETKAYVSLMNQLV